MMPFMGVRISWLMFARNSLLARLAVSAALLGDAQLLFGLPQFGRHAFQFAIRGRQFLGPRFGGGRSLGDPQFQGLVELLQLLEAFGVFQGGAGDRGDEIGQPLLVGAEQALHLVMGHVQAGGRAAAHENRRAERRSLFGEEPCSAASSAVSSAKATALPACRVARNRLVLKPDAADPATGTNRSCPSSRADLQDQAMFAAEKPQGRVRGLRRKSSPAKART